MQFSVIVPVYAAENYLHRCVQSVLNQTVGDFQLVLVDDGSYDSSGDICDAYAAQDDRVLVVHQQNSGVSAARNRGLACATADYVTFLDADDYLPLDYLEQARRILNAHPQVDYLQFGWRDFEENQPISEIAISVDHPVLHTKEDALKSFLEYRTFNQEPWGKVISRLLARSVEFPVDITIGEDLAVTHRWLDGAKCVASTQCIGYYYCRRQSGAMGSRKYRGVADAARVYEQMWRYFYCRWPQLRTVSTGRYASDLMQLMRDLQKMEPGTCRENVRQMLCHQLQQVFREDVPRTVTKVLMHLAVKTPRLYFWIYDLRDRRKR